MNTSAIKACNQCWTSYTRERWGELPIVETGNEAIEHTVQTRRCRCGEVLQVNLSWLLHDEEDDEQSKLDDPTEIFLLPDGNILLLWPVADGSYTARKLEGARLRESYLKSQAIEGT